MASDHSKKISPRIRQWGQEKRFDRRVEVKWPVVILTTYGALVAETKNLSPKGAFICCKPPLLPEQKVKLFVMVPNRRALEVSAEVAWANLYGSETDATPSGMGVCFRGMSDGDRQFLMEFATSHTES